MYQLTIKGKPVGVQYASEEAAIAAVIRLWPSLHGLGWQQCRS